MYEDIVDDSEVYTFDKHIGEKEIRVKILLALRQAWDALAVHLNDYEDYLHGIHGVECLGMSERRGRWGGADAVVVHTHRHTLSHELYI